MGKTTQKIAIISDIHANMDAFESVLADIDKEEVDDIISLGDNIGYGPEAERVIETIRSRNIRSVKGNHELAISEEKYLKLFNPSARESLQKTIKTMPESAIQWCCGLPEHIVDYGARFVHGFPPSSPLIYLFQVFQKRLEKALDRLAESICFVGHTHELESVFMDQDGIVQCHRLHEGVMPIPEEGKLIINVGSVGQPRDGDNRSKYVIWHMKENFIEVRFVPYDIASVAGKIIQSGFPKIHADRLW